MHEIFTPIRQEVRLEAERPDLIEFPTLHADVHTAASLLQKAIRRSDEALALSAAQKLFWDDPRRFWRRFNVCLFEDVGLVDRNLILAALSIAPSRDRPKAVWDEVALVVSNVCLAPKTQIANHALHLAMHDVSEIDGLPYLECLGFNQVFGMIERDHLTPVQKALAAWRLSGLACGRGSEPQAHPDADVGRLLGGLDSLLDSIELSLILREGVRLVGGPLPIAAVFMDHLVPTLPGSEIDSDEIPECGEVLGLPGYVFDQHTRLGKRALRLAVHNCPNLRKRLSVIVGAHNRLRCLSSAHFEFEAALLTRRVLAADHLEMLRRVQLTGAFRCPGFAEGLYDAFWEDWGRFCRIREGIDC